MPDKGKWSTAGLIMDEENNFSIGWRILDAQYWGVPQRRRRIFLVADFSGTSAGEILFKREGLSWHFAQSREAWQTATGSIETSSDETGRDPIYSIDREAMNSGYEFDRKPGIDESETAYTLKAAGPGGVAHPLTYEWHNQDSRITGPIDTAYTLNTQAGGREGHLVCDIPMTMQIRCGCEGGGKGALIQTDQSATLSTHNVQTLFQPVPIQDQAISNGSGNGNGIAEPNDPMYTLMAETHHGVAYSLQGNMIGRSDKNGPQGSGVNEEVNFTLNATDVHGVCFENNSFGGYQEGVGTLKASGGDYGGGSENLAVTYAMITGSFMQVNTEVSPTLAARDYKGPACVNAEYIVRRLTPLECARLQGFPDWWTANLGAKEEDITEEMMAFWREVFETHRKVVTGASKPKTDKQIKKWLMNPDNDSAECKMWGNGVALPCVLYVMEGIRQVWNGETASR